MQSVFGVGTNLCPYACVLQLESDELSRVLGVEPGQYIIQEVTRNAPAPIIIEPPLPPGAKRRPGRPRKSVTLPYCS